MLDFIEETLNQMPFFVEMAIIFALLFAVFARGYHCFSFFVNNLLQKIIRIIRAICNHPFKIEVGDQVNSLSNVMGLPSCQEKAQWITQGVYAGVNLGAEATSAASQRLGFLTITFWGAPAAQEWTCTTVLSNKIFSMSGLPAKCWCRSSRIRWSHQRANRL